MNASARMIEALCDADYATKHPLVRVVFTVEELLELAREAEVNW